MKSLLVQFGWGVIGLISASLAVTSYINGESWWAATMFLNGLFAVSFATDYSYKRGWNRSVDRVCDELKRQMREQGLVVTIKDDK
jgi:hypothetical protein